MLKHVGVVHLGLWVLTGRNYEFAVSRACGVSLTRLSRLVVVAAFGLSGLTYGLNVSWSPIATEKAQGVLNGMSGKGLGRGIVSNFEMDPVIEGHRWFFHRFSAVDKKGEGVHLYARTPEGRDTYRIQAEEAFRREDGSWVFLHGRFLGFAGIRGVPVPAISGEGLVWEPEFARNLSGERDYSAVR